MGLQLTADATLLCYCVLNHTDTSVNFTSSSELIVACQNSKINHVVLETLLEW